MSRYRKQKVRRFGQIYPSRRSTPAIVLRTVLSITVMCVLGFVGWNAYGPIRDYFSGALAASRPQPEAVSSMPVESEPEETPPASPETPKELRAVYLPAPMLADDMILDTVFSQLEGSEINAVMFDLKDASGRVYFQSDLPQVERANAQTEDAVDLSRLCALLKEKGLVPMGRFSAFADPLASTRLDGAGVKYMNTDMTWLNDAPENGGKGWLNPYAQEARDYLTALIGEAASKGVERIVLDHYSFPTGVGLEFANFGTRAETIPRATALTAAIKEFSQAAEARDGQLSLYVSGQGALGLDNAYYGDQNPLAYSDSVVLGVMPAQFGDGYEEEAFLLETPVLRPYETVKNLLEHLAPALSGKEVSAMLQGYTTTGTLENNKVYTRADIEEQLRALGESGVESYVIYSQNGSYPIE